MKHRTIILIAFAIAIFLSPGCIRDIYKQNNGHTQDITFTIEEDLREFESQGTKGILADIYCKDDNGMGDIAYDLLFQRRNPSWLYSVDNGATTIWERWNSYTIENGMGPNGMNSFNHYAYGCVCQWLWETAAGICADPDDPGFRHIVMKPLPDRRLGSIDAVFESAAGQIRSSWKYEGDAWIWDFTIPEGSTASVTLPGETDAREYGSGSYRITR